MTTTPAPLAALLHRLRGFFFRPQPQPIPPELPPVTTYVMRHEWGGPEHYFACAPEHVGLALSFIRDFALTDVCREAFAHAAAEGRLPARYGEFWVLDVFAGPG